VFGFLADRIRVYYLYPAVLLAWSLMGIASGWARGFEGLLLFRCLLGFFEAGHWPCALKTTFALLNEKDRTMGNSVLQSGASLGAVLTPQILRLLMTDEPGSWRTAFVAVGAVGLLWVVLWFACLRPRDLAAPAGAALPAAGHDKPDGLAAILVSGRFWAVAILIMGAQTAWHIYRVWLMKFLVTGRGYGQQEALNFNSAYFLATDIGCLLAGAVSLWLVRRWGASARVVVIVVVIFVVVVAPYEGVRAATLHGGDGGLAVAYLADQDDVGRLPQGVLQGRRPRLRGNAHLALRDNAGAVLMHLPRRHSLCPCPRREHQWHPRGPLVPAATACGLAAALLRLPPRPL
jgi:MFS family permease